MFEILEYNAVRRMDYTSYIEFEITLRFDASYTHRAHVMREIEKKAHELGFVPVLGWASQNFNYVDIYRKFRELRTM